MKSFGEIVRETRIEKKLELKQVQEETGIDYTLLSRIEKGDRIASKEQVFHLADYYELDKKTLLVAWHSDKIVKNIKGQDYSIVAEVLNCVKERIKAKV